MKIKTVLTSLFVFAIAFSLFFSMVGCGTDLHAGNIQAKATIDCGMHGAFSGEVCLCDYHFTGETCDQCVTGYVGGNCDTCDSALGYGSSPQKPELCLPDKAMRLALK